MLTKDFFQQPAFLLALENDPKEIVWKPVNVDNVTI